MADKQDFFAEEQKAQEEIQKIKLGDIEYEPSELQAMVDKGKKVDEFAKKYDTDPESAWKAYGKTTQENKALKEEIERIKASQSTPQTQPGQMTDEQKAQARSALQDILGGKPMTDKELDTWYQSRRSSEKLLEECGSLEGEITGEDGRPKFETKAILDYMIETGIKSPEKAYKDKYEKELDTWKQSELGKAKGQPMPTMSALGEKTPAPVKITKDNLGALVNEALWGSNQQ